MLNNIPLEIQVKALEYITDTADGLSCRLVCKLWKDIIDHKIHLKTIVSDHGVKRALASVKKLSDFQWIVLHFPIKERYAVSVDSCGLLLNAIDTGNIEILSWIVEKYPFFIIKNMHSNNLDFIPFLCQHVISCGNLYVLEWLLETVRGAISNRSLYLFLIFACKEEQLEIVEWLLERYSILKETDNNFLLELIKTNIIYGNAHIVYWLIQKFDAAEDVSKNLDVLVMKAACNGNFIILLWFMQQFPVKTARIIKINVRPIINKSLECGYVSILYWLERRNFYFRRCNVVYGPTYIEKAAENGHFDAVQWAYAIFPIIFKNKELCICSKAANGGHLQLLKWLFDTFQMKHSQHINNIFMAAARGGNVHIMQWLEGFDHSNMIANSKKKVISIAAEIDSVPLMRWVYSKFQIDGSKVYREAVKFKSSNILKWMLQNDPPRGFSFEHIISVAITDRNYAVLMWLEKHSPLPASVVGQLLQTPFTGPLCDYLKFMQFASNYCILPPNEINSILLIAIREVKFDVFSWLVNTEQLRNDPMVDKAKLFLTAIEKRDIYILRWLHRYFHLTADVVRGENNSAFIIAASNGDTDILEWMVSTFKLITSDAKANYGEAFSKAVQNGHLNVLQWMVSTFDFITEMTEERIGQIIHLAYNRGHPHIVNWCKEYFGRCAQNKPCKRRRIS